MPFKPTADSETRRRAQQTLFTLSNLPVAHVVVDDKDPLVSRSKQIETFAKSVPVLLVDYSPAEKSLRFIFPSVADRTKGVREAWSSGLILQATTRTAKEWELTERLALVRPKYRRFFVRQLDPFGPDFDPDRLLVHFPLIGQAWRSLVAAVEAKGSGFYAADAYSPLPPPAPRPPGRMFPEPPAKPTLNLTTAAPRSNTFSLSRVLGQLSAGHAASSSAVAPAQQLPDAARRLEEEFERVQKELEQWKRAHGEVETEIIVSRERHALKVKEKEDDIEAQKREIVTLQRANADLTRAIDSLKECLARQVEGAALEERLARQGKDGKGLSDLLPMQGAVGAGSAAPAASLLVPRPDTLATGAAAAQRALAPSGRPEGPSVSDKSSAMDLDESPPPIAATPGTTVSRAPLALDSHPNVTVACIEPAAAKTTTSASAEEGTATMMTVSGRDDEGVGGAGESDQTGGEQDEQGRASTTRDKNQKGEISEGGVRQVFEELRALKPSDEGGERSALLPSTHDAADVAVRPDGRNDSRNNNDSSLATTGDNGVRDDRPSSSYALHGRHQPRSTSREERDHRPRRSTSRPKDDHERRRDRDGDPERRRHAALNEGLDASRLDAQNRQRTRERDRLYEQELAVEREKEGRARSHAWVSSLQGAGERTRTMDAPPDPALEVARAVVAVMLWNIHRKEEMKQHLRRLTSIEPEEIYFQATHLGGKNWALVRCANLQDAHAVIAAVNAQPLQEGKARRWPPSYPIAQVIARKSRGIFSSDIEIDDLVDYIESMYGHRAVGAAVSRNRGKVVLQMESEEAAKEVIQLGARQRTSDGDVLSFEVAVPFWRFI